MNDASKDLVVALAGAAGRRVGALALGDLDEELGDERPGEGRRERIDPLVQRVGLEVGPDEVGREAVAGVDDVGARGAGRDRPPLDALAERPTTDIDGEGHDLDVVLLAELVPRRLTCRAHPVGEDDPVHRWTSWARRVARAADACHGRAAARAGARRGPAGLGSTRLVPRSEPATAAAGLVGEQHEDGIVPPGPSCSVRLDRSWPRRELAVPGVPVRRG
jgi:hypothetical protein